MERHPYFFCPQKESAFNYAVAEEAFIHPRAMDEPVLYQLNADFAVTLQESSSFFYFKPLSERVALGCSLGWRSALGEEPQAQMSLWDLESGARTLSLKGHHFGHTLGAQLLSSNRLMTWGRDYCLREWELESGEPVSVRPLPLFFDEDNQAVLCSHAFSALSSEQRSQFLSEQSQASPNVTIKWMSAPGSEVQSFSFPGNSASTTLQKAPLGQQEPRENLRELIGVEAGYSTWLSTRDGRSAAAGTTYGANGRICVWDGLYDLTLLYTGDYNCNYHLEVGDQDKALIFWEYVGEDTRGPSYTFPL